MTESVLVTGASGFVGQALCSHMQGLGYEVIRAVRHASTAQGEIRVGDIHEKTDWRPALSRGLHTREAGSVVDAVVHLAARVHVMHDQSVDPLTAFRSVNTAGTLNLARQAAADGVRRFFFLSTVKVNGESTRDIPFCEADAENPQDPYAISKWEAEQGLREISADSGMEVVILRSPLVYGPGVKANFLRLMQWVDRGVPLPLASIENRRSMIYLGNLVSAIEACLRNPESAGKTFLLSDGKDLSTPELIGLIAGAMGRPARLCHCPQALLGLVAGLLGKSAEAERLLGTLQVDSSKIRADLTWMPPFSVQEGIAETVASYRGNACSF